MMSNEDIGSDPFVGVAVFSYSDKPSWQGALEFLAKGEIEVIAEGGAGMLEIMVKKSAKAGCVARLKRSGFASKVKIWSCDDPKA